MKMLANGHRIRGSQQNLKLLPFDMLRQLRHADTAGKPALRTDRQLFNGQILRSLIDAALHRVDQLELFRFGRDHAQNRDRALSHEAQWLEGACSLGVVFKQQPLMRELAEQLFGDAVVASSRCHCP